MCLKPFAPQEPRFIVKDGETEEDTLKRYKIKSRNEFYKLFSNPIILELTSELVIPNIGKIAWLKSRGKYKEGNLLMEIWNPNMNQSIEC